MPTYIQKAEEWAKVRDHELRTAAKTREDNLLIQWHVETQREIQTLMQQHSAEVAGLGLRMAEVVCVCVCTHTHI